MKILKVNCNAQVSEWLSKLHPELEKRAASSDLPISGNFERIDIVVVGSLRTHPIDLAKTLSAWPSAPPAIFLKELADLSEFVDQLDHSPGIGRNILACALSEEPFAEALAQALQICRKRQQLGLGANEGLIPINPNMSPSWLLQVMLKELPEYMYFKDVEGRFIALSNYTATRSGLTGAGQAIGLTDHDLFDPEHANDAAKDEAMLVNGEIDRIEKEEFVTWKGNEIWVHSVKLPLVSPSGHTLGTFGISRDITERKRLAEQLGQEHKRLEDELTLAKSLQQSLLTKGTPDFRDANGRPLLTYSAKHVPSSQLSGDFYSIIRTPRGNAAFFLADVMGHGARAAMVTAMLYAAVNEIHHLSDSPSEFMQEMNDMLYTWLGEPGHLVFATGMFCLIDLAEKMGEICQSGSAHALLPGDSDSTIPINPALGLIPGGSFQSAKFPIGPGERIAFFTDGIIEATNPQGDAFGIERIARSLAKAPEATLDQKLDSLIGELRSFSGRAQENDDICLLLVQLA